MSGSFLTVSEIAERLRVHAVTVRRWIASGELRAYKAGRSFRIDPADLRAFMDRQGAGDKPEGGKDGN